MKFASHSKTNIVRFHLYEETRAVRATQTETGTARAGGGWGARRGWGIVYQVQNFSFSKMKQFWRLVVLQFGCSQQLLNCTLKNGQDGSFYVLCVLSQQQQGGRKKQREMCQWRGLSNVTPLPPEAGGGEEKGPCLELPERKAAPENPVRPISDFQLPEL